MAIHQPAQPVGVSVVGGTNLAFLSSLNIKDRSFDRQLMEVYGTENYMYFQERIGKMRETMNEEFYHYEVGGKLYPSVVVASGGSATPGATATVVIAASSHRNSGTESPLRVGEVIEIASSGIMGKILTINKGSANAHSCTVAPLLATDAFNPGAGEFLLFKGLQDVGEASDTFEGLQNVTRRVTNTITEIREDYTITDKAKAERVEWSVNGQQYYKYKGTKDAEKRFLNAMEDKLMFGTQVTNTNITSNGTRGTKGAINQITSGGSVIDYNAGSLDIADFQTMARVFDQNGAPAEIHHLVDPFQYQEIQNLLFGTYPNGAVLWDSVGGSKEAAAKYGFSSLALEGYNWHWKKYAPFSPEWKYGVIPTASRYRNYGMAIPMGSHTDPRTSDVSATFEIRWQDFGKGQIHAWDHGALAATPTNGKMNVTNSFVGYRGLQLKAANQCIILQGS